MDHRRPLIASHHTAPVAHRLTFEYRPVRPFHVATDPGEC